MKRLLSLIVTATLLGVSGGLAADGPAGTWRMTVDLGGGQAISFLISLENKNGQWSGNCLGSTAQIGDKSAVERVRVGADRLRFNITVPRGELSFDGRVPAQAGPIRGSINIGETLYITSLEPSRLTKFEEFELLKEVSASAEAPLVVLDATLDLLRMAGRSKAKVEDVRAWSEKVVKSAEAYGVRFQQTVSMRVMDALSDQPEYATVALAHAQRAERLLEPTDDFNVQMPVLEALAKLLRDSNKADEAKEIFTRIGKLEERDYLEYSKKFPFKPDAFAGRKAKSDRAVLLELFTGSECPPCVAADLAFDAVGMSYKPIDVVRLQYHIHIPAPDPLSNPTTEARMGYYKIESTPTSFFNGKDDGGPGGGVGAAHLKFQMYKKVIDAALETPARAKIQVAAQRAGEKINVNAKVSELVRPNDTMRLRLVLAEEMVRYQGGNGIRYHHHVARAFIGNPDGFPLKAATSEHPATIDLQQTRTELNAYLEKIQTQRGEQFPSRPLDLRKLMIVAFVQDNATKEVLQVAQVEVK